MSVADRGKLAKETLLAARRVLEKEEKRLEKVLWSIAHVTAMLRAVLADDAVDLGQTSPPLHGGRPDVLREKARFGVAALSLVPNPDGSWDVRINGGRAFRLPLKLGTLLRVLAAAGGELGDDALVGWKAYQHVATMLGRRTDSRAARQPDDVEAPGGLHPRIPESVPHSDGSPRRPVRAAARQCLVRTVSSSAISRAHAVSLSSM